MNDVRLMIGIPTCEMARRADFYDYVEVMDKPDGTFIIKPHGQSPAKGRNIIIDEALKRDCTHILFIDDDVIVQQDTYKRLIAHDKDIVSGLYLMRNFPHQPIAFQFTGADGRCLHKYLEAGETGLVEIVSAGLGCCLIRTDVFRGMEKPWVRLGELEPDGWCDDIGFFKRALKDGRYKMYLDLDCRVGHVSSMFLIPVVIDGKWYTQYNSSGTAAVNVPQPTFDGMMKMQKELVGVQ